MTKTQKKLIEARLKYIQESNGILTPKDVVNDARDIKSPLHNQFEWDDSIAAEKYRLDQARELIKTIYVTVIPGEKIFSKSIPYYVRDPKIKSSEQGYSPLIQIKSKKRDAKNVVLAELDRVLYALSRAQDVAEYLNLTIYLNDLFLQAENVQKIVYEISDEEELATGTK